MYRFVKIILANFLSTLILLFSPNSAYAVAITLSECPTTISTQPFLVNVSINGASPGTNYLRADLYKDGTTNYFGETFNGQDWFGGSVGTNYLPVSISQEGTGSAVLQARVGSPSLADYPSPGQYKFKIRRYTSSSNYTFSDPCEVQIVIASQTPTPTSTPTPTPSPTGTPRPTSAPTPTPNITSTPKPLITPSAAPKKSDKPLSIDNTQEELVLGLRNEMQSSSPVPSDSPEPKKAFPVLPLIFISGGLICIALAGWSLFAKLRSDDYSQ
jgi:hypothetical protein